MSPRVLMLPLLLALLVGALVPAAASARPGPTHPVATGVVTHADGSGFAWRLGVARNEIAGIPGLCLVGDHSWDAEGGSFGNIATICVAARVGGRFSLHAGRCRGVAVALGTGSAGEHRIRKLALALDPRARRVRISFPGGERVTVRAHPAPKALRLPVRLAWRMDDGEAGPSRVVAYGPKRKGAKRKVVGRWTPRVRC